MIVVIQILKAMAEMYDKKMSDNQIKLFLNDLSAFSEEELIIALKKCRFNLNKYPTVHEIIERIPNWHPSANEAWALIPRSENDSCCWTTEIKKSYFEVIDLYNDDKIAARVAFIENYNKKINDALMLKSRPKWELSLGYDKTHRQIIIEKAIEEKKISHENIRLVPSGIIENPKIITMINKIVKIKQIE